MPVSGHEAIVFFFMMVKLFYILAMNLLNRYVMNSPFILNNIYVDSYSKHVFVLVKRFKTNNGLKRALNKFGILLF